MLEPLTTIPVLKSYHEPKSVDTYVNSTGRESDMLNADGAFPDVYCSLLYSSVYAIVSPAVADVFNEVFSRERSPVIGLPIMVIGDVVDVLFSVSMSVNIHSIVAVLLAASPEKNPFQIDTTNVIVPHSMGVSVPISHDISCHVIIVALGVALS